MKLRDIKHWKETPVTCDWCGEDVHKSEERYIQYGYKQVICEKCFSEMSFEDFAEFLNGEVKQG